MVINPRKKVEIDISQDLIGKSEDISMSSESIMQENAPSKEINYFSKPSTNLEAPVVSFSRSNLSTQYREIQGENMIWRNKKLVDISEINLLKSI